jgi:methyl-accepting chemotaxis protein
VTRRHEAPRATAGDTPVAAPGAAGLHRHAQELSALSERLAACGWETDGEAERNASQAEALSDAAEQTAGNVGSVAVAVEEMGMSIQEISRNTSEAAAIAESAEREAQAAAERIQRLGDVSERAGGVVKAISAVARRTHLLALNAAIESARAGEAGRAFQVVATEVRALARQTAQAAESVTHTLEEVRADGHQAVAAIAGIRGTIHHIAMLSRAIAEAVAQQLRTADEISQNLNQAANGVVTIGEESAGVAEGARRIRVHAEATQGIAADLVRLSTTLGSIAARLRATPANANDPLLPLGETP